MSRAIVILLAAGAAWGQHSSLKLTNPFQTPEDRAAGADVFRAQCASCHGVDGKGGHGGPNLTRGPFKHAVSEEAMFRVISKGVPGTAMPGFTMNGARTWQVITYIASLGAGAAVVRGDASRGAKLVAGLRCAGCHDGAAPDLARTAERLSLPELRLALVDPGAEVAPEFWYWRGRLRDATTVEGRRLNEDTFSVQVAERSGRLRTIDKRDLAEASIEARSPMPSFAGKLSETDLDDVLAYLESLRGGRP